jgi:hypothetical protein
MTFAKPIGSMANQDDLLYVRFCHDNTLEGKIIEAWTWSPWCHVEIIWPNGVLGLSDGYLGAQTGKVKTTDDGTKVIIPSGVYLRPLDYYRCIYQKAYIRCPDIQAAYAFAKAQIGKPYAWPVIGGIVLHKDLGNMKSWICSQYVAAVALAGGTDVYRGNIDRDTPGLLYGSPDVVPFGDVIVDSKCLI